MHQMKKNGWLPFLAALSAGFLLHFLYGWLPNPLTALLSPVRESLWEHVKILFWPILGAGLWLSRTRGDSLTPWLAAALTVNALMLGLSYLWNVSLQLEGALFNIALYVLMMTLAFLLVPLFRRKLGPGLGLPIQLAAVALALLLLYFTYTPPAGVLFADLSGEVRTFFTIPV